jgi:pimeloyl-ACP methyl ester carboxylesterase
VLLLHGWPDSAYLWRNQIPFLVMNGFRAIAPHLRGFGRSERPEGVAAYSLQNAVGDVVGILEAFVFPDCVPFRETGFNPTAL